MYYIFSYDDAKKPLSLVEEAGVLEEPFVIKLGLAPLFCEVGKQDREAIIEHGLS